MNMLSRFFFLSIAIVLTSIAAAPAQGLPNTTRLLRFPTTNDRDIVFCYAGQLYAVGKEGGTARRLTSGPGYTSFARFSPDGKQIAFTSHYDGNTEVYVMPAEGGTPKRLTTSATLGRDDISDRMGPNNIVMAWENTKPLIVFRSRMNSFNSFHRLPVRRRAGCGIAAAITGAARRLRFVFARRFEDGLQPRVSRVPHLEALSRRHGGRHLDLRFQNWRHGKPDKQSSPGHLPDVGTGQ